MESTSTINAWMEELASTFLGQSKNISKHKTRRNVDTFRRRLRHHNFARTNQFDVDDRLHGLEEKFQILNRDDLADALYERQAELRKHTERWVPDVLDLLLRLSENPLQQTKSINQTERLSAADDAKVLTWAEIEADDLFDKRDPIWQLPSFSDLSSDEDEVDASTATTSPASVKQRRFQDLGPPENRRTRLFSESDVDEAAQTLKSLKLSTSKQELVLTEIHFIRHILLVMRGYQSLFFATNHQNLRLYAHVKLENISHAILQAFIERLSPIKNDLDTVKVWIERDYDTDYVQVIKQAVEHHVQKYISSLCAVEENMLYPNGHQTVSLLSISEIVGKQGLPLAILAQWIRRLERDDPIEFLNSLYELIVEYDFSENHDAMKIMFPMFLQALKVYMTPIITWVQEGVLKPELRPIFVQQIDSKLSVSTIWHEWFTLVSDGPYRPPDFLSPFIQDIFACGKTIAFIKHIDTTTDRAEQDEIDIESLQADIQSLANNQHIPFAPAFSTILSHYFSSTIASKTRLLKDLLESKCGMDRTFEAFDHIYLRKQGFLHDAFETRIFDRIDRCADNWNDRFLLSEMLEDVYAGVDCIDPALITVHSAHTSSRSMESRRRSVRILGALAIDYALPWPLANIIPKTSLSAYRRIALHLLQVRRTKHILERTAFIHAHSTPLSNDPRDQLLAQTTTFLFLQFVNSLYDHFTTGIALPVTTQMRSDLRAANTVDAMIAVHESYVSNLEFACLTSRQLRMPRDTLIGLLDMCIRFADLVSSPSPSPSDKARARRDSEDFEAGSFKSARSQRRRGKRGSRARAADAGELSSGDEDSDEFEDGEGEGEGEGYSSFIVLEENTSVVQEIRKLQVQFKRQLDFFVAGLKGVGRGGASVEEFEVLADRLDWKR